MIATTLPEPSVLAQAMEQTKEQPPGFCRNPLRTIAGSRPLTLFILVATLCIAMSIAYPNNFPTPYSVSAGDPSLF